MPTKSCVLTALDESCLLHESASASIKRGRSSWQSLDKVGEARFLQGAEDMRYVMCTARRRSELEVINVFDDDDEAYACVA